MNLFDSHTLKKLYFNYGELTLLVDKFRKGPFTRMRTCEKLNLLYVPFYMTYSQQFLQGN